MADVIPAEDNGVTVPPTDDSAPVSPDADAIGAAQAAAEAAEQPQPPQEAPPKTQEQNAQDIFRKEQLFDAEQQGPIQSGLDGLAATWLSPLAAGSDILHLASGQPGPSSLQQLVEHLEKQQSMIPDSNGKWVADQVGTIMGFALQPLTYAGAGVGGVASGAAMEALIPSITDAAIARGANSVPAIASKLVKSASQMVGATTLSSVNDAYDENANTLDVGQLAKATVINGGLGLAFGGAHMAFTNIKAKYKQAKVDANDAAQVQQAVADGIVTQNQANFYAKAKDTTITDPKLQAPSAEVLKEMGIPEPDANGDVNLSLINHQDIQNIHHVLPYEIASTETGADVKPMLSEYISRNALDKATDNDALMDSLDNLSKQHDEDMDVASNDIEQELKNADAIANHYESDEVTRASLENRPLSQSSLYDMAMRGEEHPFYIPKDVMDKAQLAKEIARFAAKPSYERWTRTIERLQREHDAIHIRPLADELLSLHEKMKAGKVLSEDEEMRVRDLANYDIPLAKTLRKVTDARVELEKQRAMAKMAKMLSDYSKVKTAQTPEQRLTALINHARGKIESKIVAHYDAVYAKTNLDVATEVHMMDDADMNKFAEDAKGKNGELGKDVQDAMSMYDQIKDKKQLFDDYIKCVTGA